MTDSPGDHPGGGPPKTAVVPEDLARLLESSGAEVFHVRPIDHGTQYRVERGPEAAVLNVYFTGKVSAQGGRSGLLDLLEGWRIGRAEVRKSARAGAGTGGGPAAGGIVPDETPRVGTDESGKGDYFGPLVVAGVRVLGAVEARELREAGARDSKTLGVSGAISLARRIEGLVGPENARVVVLPPREYEARRAAAGSNVGKLLAEINVQIFGELGGGVGLFVVDEFGKAARSCIGPRLPEGVRLVVRPRAEDDVAVAVASVLARARYLAEMDVLSDEVGFELPRGATHVSGAARRVVEERGLEGLRDVAKIHFATTARVLEGMGAR